MSSQLQFAAIMAPANQNSSWYIGLTAEQVGQYLTQNKAMLTDINAYVDTDSTVRFAVVMAPANQEWWWYAGLTAAEVGQYLTQNKARLSNISPYIDTDRVLKFAVIMAPANQEWWWYTGLTAAQVSQHLTQNMAMLTDINAYIDTDSTVKFAVIMAPANQEWWWYPGLTADQVSQQRTQNKARLSNISAYIDIDNVLKFAVIMAPANQDWWWYYDLTAAEIGRYLTQNKARVTALSPFLSSLTNSITVDISPNESGLDGHATLTIKETGAYSFSGGWSPSNIFTGLVDQDVNLIISVRDIRGTAWLFSTAGTVPIEGSFTFNYNAVNASLAANWQFLSAAYWWHFDSNASLDPFATWNELENLWEEYGQKILNVVEVVGSFL